MLTDDKNGLAEATSVEHFRAVVESSYDAIISKDLNGVSCSWNTGAEKIFGFTAQEVIGKPVTILIPNNQHDEESNILSRIRRGEKIDHYETIRQRKDGKLVNISLTVSPIKNAAGQIIGASKIARDITEQKKFEREMRLSQQALSQLNEDLERRVLERTASLNEAITQMEEFSYSVSHDLRSPSRAMAAYANAVLEDYGESLDETARGYLNKIVRGSRRMDRLIQDMLTYSRLIRSQVTAVPIDLGQFIRDIVEQYPEMQPPRASITITESLPVVMAHDSALTQVLSNLLNNAIKFIAPGTIPKIEICAVTRGGKVRLLIQDNGIGIEPQAQTRLFGMFERLCNIDAYEGTGIGLAIVRKAMEKMGGKVGAESDGIHGSTFWIELPAAQTSS